jgi:hypothetical protein
MNALFFPQAIESEGTRHSDIQDRAMQFFYEGGLCSHFFSDRSSRNKIFAFINASESNAAAFIRVPDSYKTEYVMDSC